MADNTARINDEGNQLFESNQKKVSNTDTDFQFAKKTKLTNQAQELQKKFSQDSSDSPARPTGIPQMDYMLRGGFPVNATILLAGASGTGKTILASQWLFAGYDQFKEAGLYISLTEPVTKAIKNMRKMAFYKQEYVNPLQVYFTDLRGILKGLDLDKKVLTRDDIKTVIEAIDHMVTESKAKRVVLDSVTAIAYRLKDRDLIREFIFQLGTYLAQADVNVIMTSEVVGEGYSVFGVEEFISDGIIKLFHDRPREELIRKLEIVKLRGSEYDSHPATFRISKNGFHLFPRLTRDLTYKVSSQRATTGVPGLDNMTRGGYFIGSSVLLTGASGTGKTIISLQFLVEGLKAGEKCLFVSFEESHDQLIRNAQSFGWDLAQYEKQGLLTILVSYPEQHYLEEHIDYIKHVVETKNPNRVVIDSLSSLGNVFSEEVLRDFTSRLIAYLKDKSVTTLFTVATNSLMGSGTITDARLSTVTDHIIMLRYVEIQSELKHGLLILKMRGSPHEKKMRELSFSSQGVSIATSFSGYEGVMAGIGRKIGKSTEDQLHDLFLEVLGPMGNQIFQEENKKGLTAESVQKLIAELGKQGIISQNRKAEFETKVESILGKSEKNSQNKTQKARVEPKPMELEDLLRLSDK